MYSFFSLMYSAISPARFWLTLEIGVATFMLRDCRSAFLAAALQEAHIPLRSKGLKSPQLVQVIVIIFSLAGAVELFLNPFS
jgi:hypothetical protein